MYKCKRNFLIYLKTQMELRLPEIQELTKTNPVTGTFIKGHSPHNKGKKAKNYMSEQSYNKMLKGLRRTGNKDIWKERLKPIIAIKDKETLFESSEHAARVLGVDGSNIRKVLRNQRKTVSGYKFKYV